MKYFRLTILFAVSLAMMVPAEIFAECCCSSGESGCCAVKVSQEVPESSCCNCEQIHAEQEALLECVPVKIGKQERSSCECCLSARLNTSAVPVNLNNVDLGHAALDHLAVDSGSQQQVSTKYVETVIPAISNNKRQALLCVWIH